MSINQLEPYQLVGFKKDKNLDLYRLREVKVEYFPPISQILTANSRNFK